MSFSTYKKALLTFLLVIVGGLLLNTAGGGTGYTRLLPDNQGFQMSYIFWMSAIAAIIGGVLIGFLLGPLFLFVHKLVFGQKMIYGIQERPEPKEFKGTFRGFFPSLMALNFAMMFSFNPWISELVINPAYSRSGGAIEGIEPLLVLATLIPLMMGISMGLFSPVWILLDSGIVFTNKKKVQDKREPVEVKSVGGWYMYLLKGYAGIGVILSYYTFSSEMIQRFKVFNPGILLVLFMPIILTIMAIPAVVLLDKFVKQRKAFMVKFAKKIGISEPLIDPLDIGK